jgi:predicted AlkP superfamily pyrophosphatase or phosphodiesterase
LILERTRIILVGLDGCDFRILQPLLEDGHLPTFSELIENGCNGALISTLSSNTLPAWTSIFTGVNPGKHGITGTVIKEGNDFKIANSSQKILGNLHKRTGSPVYEPCQLLKDLVKEGHFGRKTGKGFFEYESEQ